MPSGVEVNPKDDSSAEVVYDGNSVSVIYNDADNSYVVNGKTLHFQDVDEEVVNTALIPYILQELDGNKRI